MTKTLKRVLITLSLLLLLFISGLLFVNHFIKNKVEHFISNRLPANFMVSYEDIDLASLSGSITVIKPQVKLRNKQDATVHTLVVASSFIINDLSYWNYIFNKEISIKAINVQNPEVTYYQSRFISRTDSIRKPIATLFKPLFIEKISINQASINVYDNTRDSLVVRIEEVNLKIQDIKVDSSTLSRKLPFNYESYKATGKTVSFKASSYEKVSLDSFEINQNKATLSNVSLKSKYDKAALSKKLSKERDYYNLLINKIQIDKLDFGFNSNTFYGGADLITIDSPDLELYRDKRVADNTSFKKLYSQMLRELPIDLTIEEIKINNGKIQYSEKVNEESKGGKIDFKDLDARLTHVGNTFKDSEKTKINAKTLFMDNTPVEVDWSFNVQDTSDSFLFRGSVGKLPAEDMNQFTEPNLHVKFTGKTYQTYFTIDGNADSSNIDIRMKYDDLKIKITDKNGRKTKKLLSGIANLFIKKNSEEGVDNFRKGNARVQRDKTKSFFNYIWLNLKEGLISILS